MNALTMRAAQRRFLRLTDEYRLLAFLARRQYGKTTTFARIALKKMMKRRDHTVIFGSAKLNLSREVVRKEAEILQSAISALVTEAKQAQGQLQVIDSETHKIPDKLTADDFAGLFEAQRLEFRFFHSRSSYSRTKVVALRPDTVGETGDLMCDEIGFVKNWREVWEAISPIVSSNPDLRITLSTTPPPDDTHYAYEMLVPPVGTEFQPNPEGNLYRSDFGVMVLRVDDKDAFVDGVPVYDETTGEALNPDEARLRAKDKDAHDRNFGVKFVMGGVGACGIMAIDTAQQRGIGKCVYLPIEDDAGFENALKLMLSHLGPGRIGIGMDVATTTKQKSNPSAVSVCERSGVDYIFPSIFTWKTSDEQIAEERIRRIIETIALRPEGGRAVKLCIDGTNERYFASGLKKSLRGLLPVEVVVGSEAADRPTLEAMNMKQLLGSELIAELDDNHLTLPPERYIRDDWRLVKKERGVLVCEPDVDGKHGDTFDGSKLALRAVCSGGGKPDAAASRVGTYQSPGTDRERRMSLRPNIDDDRQHVNGVTCL